MHFFAISLVNTKYVLKCLHYSFVKIAAMQTMGIFLTFQTCLMIWEVCLYFSPSNLCANVENLTPSSQNVAKNSIFLVLYKHTSVPLSGSAKHMRRYEVIWVRSWKISVCSASYTFFVAKVLSGLELWINSHSCVHRNMPVVKLFLISDQFWATSESKGAWNGEKGSAFWHKWAVWLRCGHYKHRAGTK